MSPFQCRADPDIPNEITLDFSQSPKSRTVALKEIMARQHHGLDAHGDSNVDSITTATGRYYAGGCMMPLELPFAHALKNTRNFLFACRHPGKQQQQAGETTTRTTTTTTTVSSKRSFQEESNGVEMGEEESLRQGYELSRV